MVLVHDGPLAVELQQPDGEANREVADSARSSAMDDPMAEGDVGAAYHLEFADLEPARVTEPCEEVPPGLLILLHPPELWRASHIEHANIGGVMSNDAGEVMSFDSLCPCCNQPTNLSFISVLSGCAHTGPPLSPQRVGPTDRGL